MKTIVGRREEIIAKAQNYINSFPKGCNVAVAYNEDTSVLNLCDKHIIQIMDCGHLLSDRFNFDVPVDAYSGEEIELAVLGLGYKGQIGFNEVATPYNSTRHIQKLTDSTKEQYSKYGDVPNEGITLGIKDIVNAKNIMVFALGEKKSDAVFKMLYGRDDSTVPAAFLQLPLNVTVFVDEEAGSKL